MEQVKKKNKKKAVKRQNIIQLVLVIVIIILLNVVGSFVFTRIDLTTEKRYTLSGVTKNLIIELDDVVYFKVYLEGDFPAGFQRLRNETKEMLNEFRAYSDNIEYEFVNPMADKTEKEKATIYQQLTKKGLLPTQLNVKNESGSSQKIIFPGAVVVYKGREQPLQLLDEQMGKSPEVSLNSSIQTLEYKISSTIRKLVKENKDKIGFLKGQGELENIYLSDAAKSLSDYYDVSEVTINNQLKSLDEYKALIIAKPDSTFDEKDKFILDQFIMKGGKVLWLIDAVYADMDSLRNKSVAVTFPKSLNLKDMLFKYGVRINTNLIMDMQALPIPVVTGMIGNQPQQSLIPWPYFPIITPRSNHPIVKNVNAIKTHFVNNIDTVGSPRINKTVLLTTSEYSKKVSTPNQISLKLLKESPTRKDYIHGRQPIAVLLEGAFESVFKNRIPKIIEENEGIGFTEISKPNKMIVIADGDIIKNQTRSSGANRQVLPLGYDKYTGQSFGNKDLILNAMNFLCDDSGLLALRGKDFKLRLLNKSKLQEEKLKWQIINTVIPIVIIFVFGIIQYYCRKRKYQHLKIRQENKTDNV